MRPDVAESRLPVDIAAAPVVGPVRSKKQAVVLIHGIGEQRPMATLWKLVDLVWTHCPAPPGAPQRRVYSEPDEASGVFELRRLSTSENADGRRTDFFEYYWAHLMNENELGDVLGWLGRLAVRRKDQVPPHLHKAWRMLRVGVGVLLGLLLVAATSVVASGATGNQQALVALLALAALGAGAIALIDNLFVSPVLGDAARYLSAQPKNIRARQEIREKGLKLLEALDRSGKYDRIILVGHSLGGLIAYELICHLWGQRNRAMAEPGPIQDAIAAVEAAAEALLAAPEDEAAFAAWRAAQARFAEALRAPAGGSGPAHWLVSDLVTLGAPLAHADTLLAESLSGFAALRERREVQISPPLFETFQTGRRRFSYCRALGLADDPDALPRAPHNSAAFAAVRWTNIFFPMQGLLRGDLVGGPVRGLFGPGVQDVAARAPTAGGWTPHMHYFNLDADPPWGHKDWVDHREALRTALALERPRKDAIPS
jgi:hypothetical protein